MLIGCALLLGATGPGWLYASVGGWVSKVPPRLNDWPIPAMLPFVGVALMVAGVAWYARIRASAATTHVELVGLRLSIDGEDLYLTEHTELRTGRERLEIRTPEGLWTLRSSDAEMLEELAARIRARTANAGLETEVPDALRALERSAN